MPSKIQVDQIAGATGSTVTLPSGQTLDLSSGTVNLPSASLSALNATNLTSGTVPSARLSLTSSDLPTVPTTKGGTGLTTLGTANQVLKMNSGATALEFGTVSAGIPTSETVNITDSFFSTSNMSWQDVTALDTSITPSASNSKLLIFVYLDGAVSVHHYMWNFRLSRKIGAGSFVNNVTGLIGNATGNDGSHRSVRGEYDDNGGSTCFGYFIDSPATASEVTYRIAVYNGSGGTLSLNKSGSGATNSDNWQPSAFCKVSIIELKQ